MGERVSASELVELSKTISAQYGEMAKRCASLKVGFERNRDLAETENAGIYRITEMLRTVGRRIGTAKSFIKFKGYENLKRVLEGIAVGSDENLAAIVRERLFEKRKERAGIEMSGPDRKGGSDA